MRKLSEIFKALSDETRLQMLALLMRRGELCVCDFVDAMGITQSKASRHLRYLLHAGLVCDRRNAVWCFYRIAEQPVGEAGVLLDAVRPILETQDLDLLDVRIERRLSNQEEAPMCCRKTIPRATDR